MPPHVFRQARFLTSAAQLSDLPAESQAEVAFAGRSNAGKSSALNTLADHRRLAFVSKTPGRTQLLNYFDLGNGRSLVDLPGFGYAKVPMAVRAPWGRLLGDYLLTRQSLRGLVLVMDSRHPMTDLDMRLLEWFLPTGKPVHVLLTKADKLSRGESTLILREVRTQLQGVAPNHSVQLFSSLKKTGVEEIEAMLAAWLEMTAEPADEGGRAGSAKKPGKKPAARRPNPKPKRRTYG